jgi:hypothetical protein
VAVALHWERFTYADDVAAERVTVADARFLPALGEIGEIMVDGFCQPANEAAFRAWLEEFVPRFEELTSADGGKWSLLDELTWPLFCRVIDSMRKGKAVGAGGLSSELLKCATSEVLRTLYDAIIADVRSGRLSGDWQKVIYVLLPKGAPNNPEWCVSGVRLPSWLRT